MHPWTAQWFRRAARTGEDEAGRRRRTGGALPSGHCTVLRPARYQSRSQCTFHKWPSHLTVTEGHIILQRRASHSSGPQVERRHRRWLSAMHSGRAAPRAPSRKGWGREKGGGREAGGCSGSATDLCLSVYTVIQGFAELTLPPTALPSHHHCPHRPSLSSPPRPPAPAPSSDLRSSPPSLPPSASVALLRFSGPVVRTGPSRIPLHRAQRPSSLLHPRAIGRPG